MKGVITCLDVRASDQGDHVVTKGDQYNIREKNTSRNIHYLDKLKSLALIGSEFEPFIDFDFAEDQYLSEIGDIPVSGYSGKSHHGT